MTKKRKVPGIRSWKDGIDPELRAFLEQCTRRPEGISEELWRKVRAARDGYVT